MLVLIGLAVGTCQVVFEVVIQREVEQAYLGRVFGFAQALTATTMMGAVAAAPLVNALARPGSVIAAAGAWLVVAAAVALTFRARTRRIAPA